jgi:4-amino-4-deoxy-L-arabinose transferase-like glycosyltransferase
MSGERGSRSVGTWRRDIALLSCIAAATVIVHLITGHRYGFHRDELATLDDARHPAWGYVAYPPLTPFFGRISLSLFGTSLTGFRFFASLADAVAVLFIGLMTRELGGGRSAQLLAALAAVPFCLAAGTLMQYVSFDYLWWVLVGYFFARLCRSNDDRWWLAIGASIGLGMLTKYTVLFCAVGVAFGVLLTPLRRQLKSKWLWLGVALSLLIFSPNVIWQIQHHFVSLDFLRHIHQRDVRIGRTKDFLPDQLLLMLFAVPLAASGLWFYLLSEAGRAFRALAWLYLTPFVLFLISQGRGYYLAPAYPVLYAGGSVWLEHLLRQRRAGLARPIWVLGWTALAANVLVTAAYMLPLAPINSPWWRRMVALNNDFAEEIGWPDLVETVARIRDALPDDERSGVAILAANYGEAGAINLYGSEHGLPRAISGVNSYWARGYGDISPETLIVLGFSREFVESYFEEHQVVAVVSNRYDVANEETTRHREIYLCRRLKMPWADFWRGFQRFG